jgi:hypothetical protein
MLTQEPDIQMIRRTACYPTLSARSGSKMEQQQKATAKRVMGGQAPAKSGTGGAKSLGGDKMQFGSINERTLQQMGHADSLIHLDVLEIEPENTATQQLREAMVNRLCDEKIYRSEVDHFFE